MSTKAIAYIMQAYWSLGDHFSRLGGSARYLNMPESDIALVIGCKLAVRISATFREADYISPQLSAAAAHAPNTVEASLHKIEESPDQLTTLLVDFIAHVDGKYQAIDRSQRWEDFIAWARDQSSGRP